MKWTYVGANGNSEVYELWQKEKKLLAFYFNPSIGSARISYDNEKRAFQVRTEGFMKNKTVIRNEYGYRIGKLYYENDHVNQGYVETDSERLRFIYSVTSREFLIYKPDDAKPFITCGLNLDKRVAGLAVGSQIPQSHINCLLLFLCWYVTSKKVLNLAV